VSPDEISRRLRDEGMAQAPPDLAPEVMRQVAREPRKRRRPWPRVRPIAAWATAAAAIAAGGFALSQLGGAGSSSSASSSAASGAAETRGALPELAPSSPRVYTVASRDATRILQLAGVTATHGSYLALHGNRIVAAVPARKLNQVAARLAAAQRNPGAGPKVRVRLVPRR
jgi:hypothetical protein